MPDDRSLYRAMLRIRRFEETLLEGFSSGVFAGTTHTSLGQEANAVGVLTALQPGEAVFSNHRCHGHFLAYGGDPRSLFAELMGRATGVCGGRGGSQHIHWRDFYSNGILGSTVPVATGAAVAEKLTGSGRAVVVFLGDGTFGEGVVYEALNMASLWQAPILYVVENNRIAQTTPIELHLAGSLSGRFSAFDIPSLELDTSDVSEILPAAASAMHDIRSGGGPRGLILNTCRFGPHSKGDDTRPPEDVLRARQERDPLDILRRRLAGPEAAAVEEDVETEIQSAYEQALSDPVAGTHG
ncbi:MAG: thiamine pyrophosphate-dependent dehydrogenase E1 component subunit alpha [Anaerolineales bacterium]|nr:thiamine pyrophosphate-dependent dehydrogenase E1 component subunit alpha [Anaerolineales bacterium]